MHARNYMYARTFLLIQLHPLDLDDANHHSHDHKYDGSGGDQGHQRRFLPAPHRFAQLHQFEQHLRYVHGRTHLGTKTI